MKETRLRFVAGAQITITRGKDWEKVSGQIREAIDDLENECDMADCSIV